MEYYIWLDYENETITPYRVKDDLLQYEFGEGWNNSQYKTLKELKREARRSKAVLHKLP